MADKTDDITAFIDAVGRDIQLIRSFYELRRHRAMVKRLEEWADQLEIVSFDRSQIFAAGVYQISPISPSSQRRAKQKAASQRRIRSKGVRPENAKFGKRTQHRNERKIAVKETASLAAAIERIEASEPKIDTPEAKQFNALMGRRTHGAVSKKATQPLLSSRNFTRRAQYVRDMNDPDQ